ncbi:D-Tyr tRNAtyr deacylase-like domain-containing protein [Thamnocephalis sphaerospora]|uniref:D-aminoacyl-tRNA deacylase n=1 Tax=Thamnocephalis sphaerospora TaxID=78915 RepID=A0A4P9XGN3_9FUNG|nr:D-Tyr tRNAtyr deacylase-like domain-containing protein [Thamnocephalis sphaerospora]|eukprot:RKP04782.1 D-Tyr tRNAtyr deacylase-like domain-containing protein [Thamnocephalis sphaerospora]
MKAIIQRVLSASVTVDKEVVSSIGRGVLVFACVAPVSQFTLLARTKKGTKPDFHGSALPEDASRLYHYLVQKVKSGYEEDRVKDGKFQAMMQVALVNDGPVTFELQAGGKAADKE